MKTKEDLLNRFAKFETKEIIVKAWDNMPVKIKKLSISEYNQTQAMMMNDATPEDLKNGKMAIAMGKMLDSQLLAVSYALVEPKMSFAELGSLDTDGQAGISEIYSALEEWDKPKKSKAESFSSN